MLYGFKSRRNPVGSLQPLSPLWFLLVSVSSPCLLPGRARSAALRQHRGGPARLYGQTGREGESVWRWKDTDTRSDWRLAVGRQDGGVGTWTTMSSSVSCGHRGASIVSRLIHSAILCSSAIWSSSPSWWPTATAPWLSLTPVTSVNVLEIAEKL